MTRRPLHGWLTAEAISLTGTRLSTLALPWFALTTTGSPTKTGLVTLFEVAPMVLLKILGGPWIDRLGARRVAITCDTASVLVVGLIPLLYAADQLHFVTFLLLVAAAGALRGPGDAAKQALAPQVAIAATVPTERVTGLYATVERSASMIGAAVGGVLIAAVGAPGAITVDACSFLVSASVMALTTTGLRRPRAARHAEPYLRQLREGWSFLRLDRVLLGLMFMVALTNLLDSSMSSVLMPVWGHQRGSVATIGLLMAVFAGCSAIGSAVAAAYASRLPRYWIYLVGFIVCGVPRYVALAFHIPLWTIVAIYVLAGFGSGFLNPILGAVELERIPAPLVGRVTSLVSAAAWGLMPLGGLLGGGLVSWVGLTYALLVVGGAY
ncbi:MAG: MFS transporter, partial [Nocardioides sp.]|nr:MFS transporter [Nocardioides sp.]